MNLIACILNVLFFGFTFMVILTDGLSKQVLYNVFAFLLLLVPIFSVIVIFNSAAGDGWFNFRLKRKAKDEHTMTESNSSLVTNMKMAASISNIVLIVFSICATVDQYPHPDEEGYIPYLVFVFLTPVFSLVTLFPWKKLAIKS
jgi:hypothetical protein